MSLVSNTFLLFVLLALIVYYIVPARFQWIVLLLFSYVYYMWGGPKYVFYILFSTVAVYSFGRLITHLEETGASKKTLKLTVAAGLIVNLGMLGIVKYSAPFTALVNSVTGTQHAGLNLVFPLGISFYTFQSSGYLLDVYWDRVKAEKNIFKFALFVSFFPQLLQGPIGKFGKLHHQFFEEHKIDTANFKYGMYRILTGFAKKMIIADWAGVFADAIWADMDLYNGIALFGLLFYGIQLYADFSGAMDVVIGTARLFGIELDENFRRPYLATSMADFWKRWHITLGDWMMNYVFYPISLSKWMMGFAKHTKKIFGRRMGRVIPIALADIIVFFFVGIWHGASWKYVVYGFLNGGIIAFSELLTYKYRDWKKALHITGKETWWHVFMVVRTFIIVNLRWFFDRSDTVGEACHMIRCACTHFDPAQLLQIPAGSEGTAFVPYALLIIAIGSIIMVVLGTMQEMGKEPYEKVKALPDFGVFAVYVLLFVLIGFLGSTAAPRGFIYAQF